MKKTNKESELVKASIDRLYQRTRGIFPEARCRAHRAVKYAMIQAYWEIGRIIVEEEQGYSINAKHRPYLIACLSQRLSIEFGKVFEKSNLYNMRSFFLAFPRVDAVRQELTWTHYRLLLKVDGAYSDPNRPPNMIECGHRI